MNWRYWDSMRSDYETAGGKLIATVTMDAAGWWWLRYPKYRTVRRIWPTTPGERRLTLNEVYRLAEEAMASLEAANVAA